MELSNITENEKSFDCDISKVASLAELEEIRLKYLGKKGLIQDIMAKFREVPVEQKREFGQKVNALKNKIETEIENKKQLLLKEQINKEIENTKMFDYSLPVDTKTGSLHPRTIIQKQVVDIFKNMGFVVEDGNEVETEYNNFESVNVPKNHPARDMQDTFWLENGELLKTQTSAAQNKIMLKYGAPLKAIFPGRCFRNEALDASHENTFFQMEGMMIDKDVSISNLIYFMKTLLSEIFKKEVEVRLRPGFFPFVEPGFELDIKCPYCDGAGCKVCKNGSWIELCPCGMIHPNVLKMGGIDPEKYSGFAFGLGLSRLAMMKYNINDLRALNSCDVRILKQMNIK